MRAKPSFSRATLGLLRPKHRILGGDIVGRVDAVGSGVTQFKPGDEVYANLLDHGSGGFAEYVSVLRRDGLAFDDSEPDSTTLSWDAEVGEVDVDPPIVGQPGRTSWSAPGWVRTLDVSSRCNPASAFFTSTCSRSTWRLQGTEGRDDRGGDEVVVDEWFAGDLSLSLSLVSPVALQRAPATTSATAATVALPMP